MARALSGSAAAPFQATHGCAKGNNSAPIPLHPRACATKPSGGERGVPILVVGAAFSWRGNAAAPAVFDRAVHRDGGGNPHSVRAAGGSASNRDRPVGGACRRVRVRRHEHHQSSSPRTHGLGVLGRRPGHHDLRKPPGRRADRVAPRQPVHPRHMSDDRMRHRHPGPGIASFLQEGPRMAAESPAL